MFHRNVVLHGKFKKDPQNLDGNHDYPGITHGNIPLNSSGRFVMIFCDPFPHVYGTNS